jgi:hypothetical protein
MLNLGLWIKWLYFVSKNLGNWAALDSSYKWLLIFNKAWAWISFGSYSKLINSKDDTYNTTSFSEWPHRSIPWAWVGHVCTQPNTPNMHVLCSSFFFKKKILQMTIFCSELGFVHWSDVHQSARSSTLKPLPSFRWEKVMSEWERETI